MSVNSQLSYNFSIPYLNTSSTNFTFPVDGYCHFSKTESLIFITFCIVNIFLFLPLCIFILRHGFQQWQQNSSTVRHSDCFAHHVAILQLFGVFGCFLCFCGICGNYQQILSTGYTFYAIACFGETFFHILMCLEQYLAVVHPITYMGLRKERGIRTRNISICCTWVLNIVGICLIAVPHLAVILTIIQLTTAVAVISFCCKSILCVLVNLGSKTQVRDKVDPSKQRAFYTILVILGVLTLKLSCGLVCVFLGAIKRQTNCWLMILSAWVSLPSSLVLPLLFLQRAGKCVCLIKEDKRQIQ